MGKFVEIEKICNGFGIITKAIVHFLLLLHYAKCIKEVVYFVDFLYNILTFYTNMVEWNVANA